MGDFFGSDNYIAWLKDGLARGDEEVTERLLLDVNEYARGQIRGKVRPDEVEDVIMAVDCSLLTHIASFLFRSGEFSPFQRQNWLKTLIRNATLDHLQDNRWGDNWRTRKNTDGESSETMLLSWEEYIQKQDLSGGETLEEKVIGQASSQVLDELVELVCSMGAEPAALLAFLYHNVVFFLAGDSVKKGRPQETLAHLNGKTLGQLRDGLPDAICAVSGYQVDRNAFRALDLRLAGRRDDVFRMNSKKLSASVSYLKSRVSAEYRK